MSYGAKEGLLESRLASSRSSNAIRLNHLPTEQFTKLGAVLWLYAAFRKDAVYVLPTQPGTDRYYRDPIEGEVEPGVPFPTICDSVEGESCIEVCGSFSYRPKRAFEKLQVCPPCRTSDAAKPLQISNDDIVGATMTDEGGFCVWYMPVANPSSSQKRRRLQRLDSRLCETREAAQLAVSTLQRLDAWWGREAPPSLVVFINPVSGTGRSKAVWRRECLPILEAAGLRLRVVETQRPQHAAEEARTMDFGGIDAIVCLGGDGTMSEILQGVFEREDADAAIEVPLCMIPGGTGNGMAASTGLWSPATAAHALCKGQLRRMDVASVFQPPSRRYYSFLSLTYGFIANVDIGTEHLRWMGSFRNQLGAVFEILKSGVYPAQVAVAASAPQTAAGGGIGQGAKRPTATPLLDRLGPLERMGPLATATLPEDPLHLVKGWQRLKSTSFSLFTVSMMPYLALDFTLVPSEQIDSGEMTLTHMPGGLTRWQALRTMLKADAGKITDIEQLGVQKLSAFILEPSAQGTWLVMDGEVLPFERVFVELHAGICRAIVAP